MTKMDYNMMHKDDDFDGLSNNMNSGYQSSDSNGNMGMSSNGNMGMSKAELRKSNKPIMEKRRRARINHCLNELKTLILEAMKKDPARHTKLEKADILEMTVKHLQSVQRQQLSMAIQSDPTVIHKFKTGFVECADEVNRYVAQLDNVEPAVRQRLVNHLNSCATGIDQIGTFNNFSTSYRSTFGNALNQNNPMFPTVPQDVNNNNNNAANNGRIQMGGVQLIPQRLPSGELALIMPNTNSVPSFMLPNMPAQPSLDFSNTFPRMSAFTKPMSTFVTPSRTQAPHTKTTTTASPPLSPVSSVSSLGDESSLMHTSSDFLSKTPPLDMEQSFSGVFPTPPSTESTKFVSRTSHLQQSQVSSTSDRRSADDSLLRKRSCPLDDSSDSLDEPSAKKFANAEQDSLVDNNGNFTTDSVDNEDGANDSMWRPW